MCQPEHIATVSSEEVWAPNDGEHNSASTLLQHKEPHFKQSLTDCLLAANITTQQQQRRSNAIRLVSQPPRYRCLKVASTCRIQRIVTCDVISNGNPLLLGLDTRVVIWLEWGPNQPTCLVIFLQKLDWDF